jgi:putative heme-binding domain-containing protein
LLDAMMFRTRQLPHLFLLLTVALQLKTLGAQEATDPAQLAKDTRTVETLLRLKTIDPNSNPKLAEAVSRYLFSVQGTARYLEVVEQLKFKAASEGLFELALKKSEEPLGIQATRALLNLEESDRILQAFSEGPAEVQIQISRLLGGVGNRLCCDSLEQKAQDESAESTVRQAAVAGLLQSRPGRERVATALEMDTFPKSLRITTAAAISKIDDAGMKLRVSKSLALPETADAEPLPPLDQLVAARGDAVIGQKVFQEKGTCSKCHVIGEAGKEVGPNLSEIGSKLSREAMFVSILDPSAGVSHNFETYFVELFDGEVVTGILLSESDEEVAIKTADAVVRKIVRDDIDLIEKQKISLMPEGLQKNMSADELIALVEYLMTLKKKPE